MQVLLAHRPETRIDHVEISEKFLVVFERTQVLQVRSTLNAHPISRVDSVGLVKLGFLAGSTQADEYTLYILYSCAFIVPLLGSSGSWVTEYMRVVIIWQGSYLYKLPP